MRLSSGALGRRGHGGGRRGSSGDHSTGTTTSASTQFWGIPAVFQSQSPMCCKHYQAFTKFVGTGAGINKASKRKRLRLRWNGRLVALWLGLG